jgi:hypothetical protein
MLEILRWGFAGVGFVIVAGVAAMIGAIGTYFVWLELLA